MTNNLGGEVRINYPMKQGIIHS